MVKINKSLVSVVLLIFAVFAFSSCTTNNDDLIADSEDNNVENPSDAESFDASSNTDNDEDVSDKSSENSGDSVEEGEVGDSFVDETEDIEIGSLI